MSTFHLHLSYDTIHPLLTFPPPPLPYTTYDLQVNSILRHVAEILGYESDEQLEELYNNSAWFYDRKYGHPGACYDAFKLAITFVRHFIYTWTFFHLLTPFNIVLLYSYTPFT